MKIQVAKQKPEAIKADLFVVPVQEGAETAGAVKELRNKPDLTYREAREIGEAAGFTIYPVIMTQARERAGIPATRGRKAGSKNRPKKGAPRRTATKAGTRKAMRATSAMSASTDPGAILTNLATHMSELEQEVAQLREAMAQISAIAATV